MEEKKVDGNKIFKWVVAVLLGLNLVVTSFLFGSFINQNVQSRSETIKYTLYIGTNDKDTYKEEIPFDECMSKVTDICVEYTGGCTIFEATGYWKDDNNAITKERTIGCILEDIEKEIVFKICDKVIIALNQNSILVETNSVYSTFYSTASAN